MTLSCCHVVRQMVEIDLLRRPRAQARVWPSFIVKSQVPAERSTRIAYAVIGPQVDLLVFHRAPQPLDEHVVSPGAAAIHADADRLVLQHPREGRAGELAALVGVEDLRFAVTRPAAAVPLPCTASRQNSASSVIDSRQASTRRLNQSSTAAR